MSKRSDSIVAVTIAKYATVFVEADSPDEAVEKVTNNIDSIYGKLRKPIDGQFEDSNISVDSYEAYVTGVEDYMDYIWCDGDVLSYDDYIKDMEEGI